ncbi:MAG: bifunctional glutamate N-acetyltransferase/amino-acid acetyltransferase ArgJ, partial [Actinomycetota bacterium]
RWGSAVSVTVPAGFVASGVRAGLKKSGNPDFALVQNLGPLNAAAVVFTTNRCQANPVLWSKQVIADGEVSAIALNSGGANCYTGPQGFQTTHATAERVAERLGVSAGDVLICSTGLIGEQLDREKVLAGVDAAVLALSDNGGFDASEAIMTTDSKPKRSVRNGTGWSIGGMAKGAGMLAPGLATMLVVITTDAHLSSPKLDAALREAIPTAACRPTTPLH